MRTFDHKQRCHFKAATVLRRPACRCLGARHVAGGNLGDQSPVHGVQFFSEMRTNPPTRLFVAEVDLTNPSVELRVSAAGPIPMARASGRPRSCSQRRLPRGKDLTWSSTATFFIARGVNDAEGTNSGYRANICRSWKARRSPTETTWSTSTNARPCLVVHTNHAVTIENLTQPPPDAWEVIGGNTILVKGGKAVAQTGKVATRARW